MKFCLQDFDTSRKIDWHNHEQIEADRKRTGPGEQGVKFELKEGEYDKAEQSSLWGKNGYNAIVSDFIAIDRSLKDIRHPQ